MSSLHLHGDQKLEPSSWLIKLVCVCYVLSLRVSRQSLIQQITVKEPLIGDMDCSRVFADANPWIPKATLWFRFFQRIVILVLLSRDWGPEMLTSQGQTHRILHKAKLRSKFISPAEACILSNCAVFSLRSLFTESDDWYSTRFVSKAQVKSSVESNVILESVTGKSFLELSLHSPMEPKPPPPIWGCFTS